jgi:nicotinic acid mononucleotide adenylyltransferase
MTIERLPLLVTPEGEWRPEPTERPTIVLPGSFNPVHEGHWGLARVAAEMLGGRVAFELSLRNVDKPDLDLAEVHRRLEPFRGRAAVWLTRAPRFLDKAVLFPNATFVVGADTAARLVSPRYYENDTAAMRRALDELASHGARFFVAARARADGELETLIDLSLPGGFEWMFREIPAANFRLDVSSTRLRSEGVRA